MISHSKIRQSCAYATAALLLLSACSSGAPQTKEAVRKGVVTHLSKRDDKLAASVTVDVSSVSFRENEADAVVSIKPKGSETGMQINYTLEAKGKEWVVKGRKEGAAAGGNPHGTITTPQMPPPSGELPAGHPSVETPK